MPFQLVPVQHWSARGLADRNKTLWGGWAVRAPDLHWYFSGDTGYAAHFRAARERGGPFDLALLAIGAYEPRWFMREQHMDPAEAVQAHRDLGARQSIGIHWGTFALTDEALDEPPRDLARARAAAGVTEAAFGVLAIGQTRWLAPRRGATIAAMTDTAATLPPLPCYLNGEFTTLREARVSVMDRGFIFGDGVYEVVPVYAGKPFRLDDHLARLERSLAELRMANPRTAAQWRELVQQLVDAYARHAGVPVAETNQLVYIQITRGVAMRDHVMPFDIPPTLFAMANRMALYSDEQRARGFACISADDFRWKKAHIKSTSLQGAVLSRQMSADVGAIETIMFRDGMLSEAAASNVWVVKNGVVSGSPKDNLVLRGHPLRPDRGAVPRCGHSLRAAPHPARGGAGGRRAAALVGDQGSPARHHAGRQAGWKRPARPHLREAVRRLPVGQALLHHDHLQPPLPHPAGDVRARIR